MTSNLPPMQHKQGSAVRIREMMKWSLVGPQSSSKNQGFTILKTSCILAAWAAAILVAACGGGGGNDAFTDSNTAPIARAGSAQFVDAGNTVTLDGRASSDANGDTLTYQWTLSHKPNGSSAILSNSTGPTPTFVADVAGTYVISLMVSDGRVASVASTVSVTSAPVNAAPVANAGAEQITVVGSIVTLDGSASRDPNGDTLTYSWSLTSKPVGSSAVLNSSTSTRPTFSADSAGTYIASLFVTDGQLSSVVSTVTVTAAFGNVAPVANAGPAQSAYLGDLVRLDGSASSDANGDVLSYGWSVRSYPGTFPPTVSGSSTATPSFIVRYPGTYVLALVASDGRLTSSASTVTVTVADGARPMPAGSGLIVQNLLNIWTLDEATMTKRFDVSCESGLTAMDRRPDGVVVGMNVFLQFVEVNPVTGSCSVRRTLPEKMRGIAVSPQGQMVSTSLSWESTPTGGKAHRLYKLSDAGTVQAFVYFSGATTYVESIDFSADGQLYGVGLTPGGSNWSVVRIDVDTGVTTVAFPLPRATTLGDIDIDATGTLRTMIDGTLYKFSVSSGAQMSTAALPNFPLGNNFAPIVFVP